MFMVSAASHCVRLMLSSPARTFSAEKAAAESATVVAATVNKLTSAPESWNAKNTHISFTRKGMRRNSSTYSPAAQRNGAKRTMRGVRTTASTKPAANPAPQPTSDSPSVVRNAPPRNSML